MKKPENVNSNQYFQAGEQTIYIYNNNYDSTQLNKEYISRIFSNYIATVKAKDNEQLKKEPLTRKSLPNVLTHTLHLNKKTWNEAKRACVEEGGKNIF